MSSGRGRGADGVGHRPHERRDLRLELRAADDGGAADDRRAHGRQRVPERLEPAAQDWRGHVRLRNTTALLALRASGDRLIGWIEYRGNRLPLVLDRG